MTLNEACIIAGLKCIPSLSEGEKAQLSLTFPELPMKSVGKKGEKTQIVQSVSKRAITDVTRFFQAGFPVESKIMMADMQLPVLNAVVAKAVKEAGHTCLDFYLESQALVESMEEEVQAVSAADPSNIAGQFLAATFTKEDEIPSEEAFLDLLTKKIKDYFSDASKIQESIALMTEKEAAHKRLDSGAIRWRKPRATKEGTPEVVAEQ